MKLLIGSRADVNAKDEDGRTVLDWAIHSGKFKAAQLLDTLGAVE